MNKIDKTNRNIPFYLFASVVMTVGHHQKKLICVVSYRFRKNCYATKEEMKKEEVMKFNTCAWSGCTEFEQSLAPTLN